MLCHGLDDVVSPCRPWTVDCQLFKVENERQITEMALKQSLEAVWIDGDLGFEIGSDPVSILGKRGERTYWARLGS